MKLINEKKCKILRLLIVLTILSICVWVVKHYNLLKNHISGTIAFAKILEIDIASSLIPSSP